MSSSSMLSLITAITTPSLIYIDVEGCLKFISIPLFNYADYIDTKVD